MNDVIPALTPFSEDVEEATEKTVIADAGREKAYNVSALTPHEIPTIHCDSFASSPTRWRATLP